LNSTVLSCRRKNRRRQQSQSQNARRPRGDFVRTHRQNSRRLHRRQRIRHRSNAELLKLRDAGFDAFLIGTSLMLATDPAAALSALLGGRS